MLIDERPRWHRQLQEPPAPEPAPRGRDLEKRIAALERRAAVVESSIRLLAAEVRRQRIEKNDS